MSTGGAAGMEPYERPTTPTGAPAAPPSPGTTPSAPFAAWARWFVPAAALVLALDQATKWWLFSLPRGTRFPSWIALAENKGVAWSIGHRTPEFVAIATAVLIPILAWVWWTRFRRAGAWENLAFGLILGGAVGNAIDRGLAMAHACGLEGVRDFINVDLGFAPFDPWPTFNLADAGISGGFLVLVALSFRKPRAVAPVPDR
jgi:signal peptidase II